ncbi:MAG: DUF4115 domain-containing protein [Alphaproteobacteria bacterium]|nr:DUF4115 domain-containing protein [Alphaproteobacteria bacterium]
MTSQRRPSNESAVSAAPQGAASRSGYETERIGDILRRVRLHRGEELEDISDYLRIRPHFLYALEQSRYSDLPADAYVVGFLRSYALYLGLDERGAIDQYRREMAGQRHPPQLTMPKPIPEGRAPTMAILVSAALMALAVYGLWYWLSSPSRAPLETPPELPSQARPASFLEIPPQEEETTPPQEERDETPAPPASTLLLDSTTLNGITLSETLVAQSEEPPEILPQEPPRPALYGTRGRTRLEILAKENSWILITDEKGNTVFDRVLKKGDKYRVPAGQIFKLTTSQAPLLTLLLDGQVLQGAPGAGKILRALPLDPDSVQADWGRL